MADANTHPGARPAESSGPGTPRRGRARNVTMKANTVNVTPQRARRRNTRRAQGTRATSSNATATINRGRMTVDSISHEIQGERIDPSEGAVGWFYKYTDPAGSVESGRALGEYSKVPDGLLRFSVDGEQRPVNVEECPGVSDSALPFDGALWGFSAFSFPCFRLNYIAIANVKNLEMTPQVISYFISVINNITDWRAKADGEWRLFAEDWYYKIRVLPNTFLMSDDDGRTDDITEFRKTTKGITFEFNAPTALDMGYWAGGHFPIKPRPLTVPSGGNSIATFSLEVLSFSATANNFTVGVTGQTVVDPVLTGAGTLWASSPTEFFVTNYLVGSTVTRVTPIILSYNGEIWAAAGATLSLEVTTANSSGVQLSYTSDTAGSVALISPLLVPTARRWDLEFETPGESQAFNKLSLALPAMTIDELTTNNPKMEQFLCKESGGAYLVHYKMSNPVFEMTGEENYGYFQFHYPNTDPPGTLGARGIRDTFEKNFSSAVVHFRGLSKSTSLVVKTYDDWEGTTNTGTVVGQFAHAGATEETEVVQLANTLQSELTGVYAADDNFAALVSSLASVALGGLFKSEATPAIIKSLAHKALGVVRENPGLIEQSAQAIGSIGERLVKTIKTRRAARRKRQVNLGAT